MAYDKTLVEKASAETGVPASLLERMIAAESSGDPGAVSYRGPQYGEGLMQLSEAVAKDEGVSDRFDPWQSILGGAKDMRTLLDRYGGDENRALQAYVGASTPAKAAAYIQKVTGKMPDAATTPAAAPASSGYQPAIDEALKRERGDESAYEAASKEASANDKEFASRLESLGGKIEGIDAYLDKLSAATPRAPEEAKLPGYQPPQQKNPLQALAVSMPLLLLAGSKMGRNKGLALMKSMSGLLGGVSAGNDETRKQYQEDFKAKTEQMVDQAKLDHEHYMDILESLRENKGDALAKIQVMGAVTQNQELINAAKNGDFKRVADLASIHDHFLTSLLAAQRAALTSEHTALQNRLLEMQASPSGSLGDNDLDFAAEMVLNGQPMPNMGYGTAGAAMRAKILHRAAEMAAQQNGSSAAGADAAVVRKDTLKADSSALTAATKQQQSIRQFSQTALGLADRVEALANKISAEGPQAWSKFMLHVKTRYTDDADAQEFIGLMSDLQSENAKIMAGATGSVAQVSASNQSKMDHMLTGDLPLTEIHGGLKAVREGIAMRSKSVDDEITHQRDQLRSDTAGGGHGNIPAEAVAELKADPSEQNRAFFDQTFGAGAAKSALGG